MPSVMIPPNKNIAPRYRVPDSSIIRFNLEADIAVQTYIVRPAGLALFNEGKHNFKYYGGFPAARKNQSQTLVLPFEGIWHLLIINRNTEEAAVVDYSVYYE
jgi:hypothetical protein